MALSKAEVRNAFREVAMRELSTIPPKETIDHSFSKQFYEKMVSLIAEQKRGSWRLLSRQRRRALVVAAILVLSMLLVACTPTLRNAVSDFVVSVYERFVDVGNSGELNEEIITTYELTPAYMGFEIVSQKTPNVYYSEKIYQNTIGDMIILAQRAGKYNISNVNDNEQSMTALEEISGMQVVVYRSENLCTITWIQDGYHMTITCMGNIALSVDVAEIISSVHPSK